MVKENCTSNRIWESNEFAKFRLFFRLQRVRQNTEPEFGQCTYIKAIQCHYKNPYYSAAYCYWLEVS